MLPLALIFYAHMKKSQETADAQEESSGKETGTEKQYNQVNRNFPLAVQIVCLFAKESRLTTYSFPNTYRWHGSYH